MRPPTTSRLDPTEGVAYDTFHAAAPPSDTVIPPTRSMLTQNASLLSRLGFSWCEYLVHTSHKRPLHVDDVWQLDPQDRSAATYDQLMMRLSRPRDFTRVAMQLHWRPILTSAALSLVAAIADMLTPLLVYAVMVTMGDATTSSVSIVILLVVSHVVKLVGNIAAVHSTCICSRVASRVLGALESHTFKVIVTVMKCKSVSLSEASTMFFDLTDMYEYLLVMHGIWSCPLGLIANLVLLYYLLGDAMVGSLLAAAALMVVALIFKRMSKQIALHLREHQQLRLQVMSECFKTIQSIKFNAWEHRFLGRINTQRQAERSFSRRMQVVDAVWRSLLTGLPEFVLASSCTMLVLANGQQAFEPATIFASLMILYRVKDRVIEMQSILSLFVPAAIALKHMIKFLEASLGPDVEKIHDTETAHTPDSACSTTPREPGQQHEAIRIRDAAIGRTMEPVIVMANLTVPCGSLTVIHGKTGAGKSSLLESLVDSALVLNSPKGGIDVQGRIAYCSQHPWLRSLSIRENITFGLPFDEHRYLNVLHACCLLRDVDAMRKRDATLVGPKGLRLSAGQKARIALARACYADADVYLLDSPLSSVDAIVQSDIFQRCFIDLLVWKTIILVTHNLEIIKSPYVDQVVLLKDHRLILEKVEPNRKPLNSCRVTLTRAPRQRPSQKASPSNSIEHLPFSRTLNLTDMKSTRIEQKWHQIQDRMKNRTNKLSRSKSQILCRLNSKASESFLHTARNYIQLCGGTKRFVLPLATLFAIARASLIVGHLWISRWSWGLVQAQTAMDGLHTILVFLVLLCTSCTAYFFASSFSICRTAGAADTLFVRMVRGVLFASMSFYYDHPIGEMMNRFSEDVHEVDERAPYMIFESVDALVGILLPWIVMAYILPEVMLVTPAALWLLYISRHHMKLALEMLGLLTASYAPCLEAIADAVDGRHVIQAFGPQQIDQFREKHNTDIDKLLQLTQAQTIVRSWSTLQFVKIDTIFLMALVVAITLRRQSVIPYVSLALYYVVTMNTYLFDFNQATLKFLAGTAKIRRVEEYGAISSETIDSPTVSTVVLPHLWPVRGGIVFENVAFAYDPRSDAVLEGIDLHIRPGENIGLVGRTGAGKSSLTLALFRIHELNSGRILVDGIDISLVELQTLRSRLAIVPQSPLFFKGTLRSYLDPFNCFQDVTLWELMRNTGLANVVSRLEGKLSTELEENAENLSLGERQLLCLTRVLLQQSKIVVLDEATVAIGHHADERLQRVIKEELTDTTVISIAHRLESILEFDRVVVMDKGRIVQCGTVDDLVADPNGPFFDLLEGALLKM